MIKIRFAALAVVAMAALTATARAQQATQAGVSGLLQDGKVAVVNTSVFRERISELKQKYDQLQARFNDRYQKLQNLQQQVQQLTNQIEMGRSTLAPEKLNEMSQRLDDMKKQGQRESEDFQSDYTKAEQTETKPVRDKLTQFISSYASQHGVIMIIDLVGAYQSGTLAYWSPSTDITEDFIAAYNKANPVAGVTPAAAPAKP